MRKILTAATVMLGVAGLAGAQSRPVTIDDVLDLKAVGSPAVSPDGSRVLYTVRQWEPASERDSDRREARTRIWMVPAAGGPARQITFGERGDSQPEWSPDGRFISFVSARGSGTGEDAPKGQLYLMRADGGEAQKISNAAESVTSYRWSPDSKRIAFISNDPRSPEEAANIKKRDDERTFEGDFRYAHLWVLDIESHEATRITEGREYTLSGLPSWSPDSSRIVFAAGVTPMLRDARRDIYVADVSSKQITKISPMQYVEAKKFLESMAYEASFPAASVGLAAR